MPRATLREDPTAPLSDQLAAQARKKGWTHEKIAVEARLKKERVDKFLAPDSQDIRPDAVARLGAALGLDVTHIAIAYFRDKLHGHSDPVCRRLVKELDHVLEWQNPFPPKSSFRRMAFRAARKRAGLTIEAVAAEVAAGQPPPVKALVAKKIRLFENGGGRTNEAALRRWVNAISRRAKTPVSLDEIGGLLPVVHRISDTVTWTTYHRRSFAHTNGLSVTCPPGAKLEIGYSPTIFGAAYVELFRIRYGSARETTARLSARHRGWEIGIVLEGRVRLRLRDAEGKVLSDEDCGAGDLLTFRSDNLHEVEFLEDSHVAAINLRRNVLPGRTLR